MYIQFPNTHLPAMKTKYEYYLMNGMTGTNIFLFPATVREKERTADYTENQETYIKSPPFLI